MAVIERSGSDKERERNLPAQLVLLNHWVHPYLQGLQGAKKKLPPNNQQKKRYTGMHVSGSSARNVCKNKNVTSFYNYVLLGEIISAICYIPSWQKGVHFLP